MPAMGNCFSRIKCMRRGKRSGTNIQTPDVAYHKIPEVSPTLLATLFIVVVLVSLKCDTESIMYVCVSAMFHSLIKRGL